MNFSDRVSKFCEDAHERAAQDHGYNVGVICRLSAEGLKRYNRETYGPGGRERIVLSGTSAEVMPTAMVRETAMVVYGGMVSIIADSTVLGDEDMLVTYELGPVFGKIRPEDIK